MMPSACPVEIHAPPLQKDVQLIFSDATGLPGGGSRSPLLKDLQLMFSDATGLPGGGSRWCFSFKQLAVKQKA
jgi:hypothetical protein